MNNSYAIIFTNEEKGRVGIGVLCVNGTLDKESPAYKECILCAELYRAYLDKKEIPVYCEENTLTKEYKH